MSKIQTIQTDSAEYESFLRTASQVMYRNADSWIQDIHDVTVNVHTATPASIAKLLMDEMERFSWYSETLGDDLWDTALEYVADWKANNPQ